MLGLPIVYLLPMLIGPLVAAIGGWLTAWLQYRQQKTAGSGDRLLRLVNELQEELHRAEQRISSLEIKVSTARDVLLQIVDVLPDFPDGEHKSRLMVMIREGLRVL
jgi:hypothetical protein